MQSSAVFGFLHVYNDWLGMFGHVGAHDEALQELFAHSALERLGAA